MYKNYYAEVKQMEQIQSYNNHTELFAIQFSNDRPTVLARELHEYLEAGAHFKDWFPRMCEYGFQETIDYTPLKNEQVRLEGVREVKRNLQDYQLTIEMAKEICMLQRTERGKEARQYFIQLEKEWNSPQKVMARALLMSQKEIENLRIENIEMKPKALFADAVSTSKSSILVSELSKMLKQNGIEIGQNRLFDWLRDKGYLCKQKGEKWNEPTQKSMELGLMEIKKRTINNPDGSVRTTRTPKVTGKGQIYFVNKLLGN